MFRNFTVTPDDHRHEPIGALLAGIALLLLPVLRVIYGPAEPIEPGYWVPIFFGVTMLLYGSAALPLYRRNRFERARGGADVS
jgi:hypothetical protein